MPTDHRIFHAVHHRWILRILSGLWLLCCVGLIFYHSSKPGPLSDAESQQVSAWVSQQWDAQDGTGLQRLVRKAAHMAEYALLGAALYACVRLWAPHGRLWLWLPPALGLVVGAADELYQNTVPGRSGLASDVIVDLFGVGIGIFLCWAVFCLSGHMLNRKKRPPQ